MVNSPVQERSLFLCTTPLQARICLEIIKDLESNNFDLIYYTRHETEIDIEYFKKLKYHAKNAILKKIVTNIQLIIVNFTLPLPFNKKNYYSNVYLASIDNLLFRHIIKKNKNINIYTFDDGTANIFKDSSYFNNKDSIKSLIYSKIFRLPSKSFIIKKSIKHYSIFKNFDNILPNEKIKFITIFKIKKISDKTKQKTFFIGQPFEEYLTKNQINNLKNYLKNINIDFYVKHPREKQPIIEKIKELNKKKEIAEVAILKEAGENKPIIISAFSTVLFNLDSKIADKIYLSLTSDPQEKKRLDLIKKIDSKIITITE